ncbi:DUF6760 family protein [Methanobacterium formicicum]|jgi:hypothetical protein|uniref:DUF6760 family protein n=1 Tax=Methanobacterium formicicum TaxID=2162 RepID=UPI002412724B|nr:DUF6760 family protein [Methanobacterium formicicum]MDG3548131.1 hypothetical protein [Methanobacterium formicicum]
MIEGYPLDKIYEEVAFIAYHFNWSHEEIMIMEHNERRLWCEEISKINKKLNENLNKKTLDLDQIQ